MLLFFRYVDSMFFLCGEQATASNKSSFSKLKKDSHCLSSRLFSTNLKLFSYF